MESKNRLGALALANEKMEIIRNLKYDSIGTQSGIPSGNIPQNEDVTVNGKAYHVTTFIQYIDDSLDGIALADTNGITNDYKRVKITISWKGANNISQEIFLVSRFVPPGIEKAVSGGTLFINVVNNVNGSTVGVPQSTVHIVNNNVSPAVNITVDTDNSGNLIFPGAKASVLKYQITLTKSDYETVTTIDPNSVTYVPTDQNATVIDKGLTQKTITQNKLANLKVTTRDYLNNSLPNVNFHITGGRALGTNNKVNPYVTIYNIDQDSVTNSSGEKDFNNISPGPFSLTPKGSLSGYTFVTTDPAPTAVSPPVLSAGGSLTIKMKFAANNVNALIVKVTSKKSGSIITGAQVKLTNASGYDQTVTTLGDGIAFFPLDTTPLVAGSYTVLVKATGFKDNSSSITVSNLTTSSVKMVAN